MDYQEQIKELSDRKQKNILKSVALNNACVLVAGLTSKERLVIKNGGLTAVVIAIAKEFETYLKED